MPSMKGFHALRRLPEEKITDKISRRVLVGDKEMVVWWSMKAGAHAPAPTRRHEQIFGRIWGTREFRLGGEKRTCRAGDAGVIAGGVEHGAWFPEDTEAGAAFAPPREDFHVAGPARPLLAA